jgi:RNA polymerase sigma-70 factor, ECF subfamily
MTDAAVDPAELVRRLHQGDATAAHLLYETYGAALLRFGVALCGNLQTAEDVVHDTFVELLRYPTRFDPTRGSLSSYLYAIARHQLARVARVARRQAELDVDDSAASEDLLLHEGESRSASALTLAARDLTTEGDAERAHIIEQVRAAVLDLPLIHREVIALCDLEELPYTEVATVLNCPMGTVRSRLFRARALLAQRLSAGFADKGGSGSEQPERGSDEQTPSDSTMMACRGTLT